MHWKGLMTALVTPLREDRFDEEAFDRLVERQLEAGVSGLVPCGTTGEAATLTTSEWEAVVGRCVDRARGRAAVVAGVGSNSTRATVANARRAERLGVQGVLVVTPYYNKPTQEGLYRHFREVAEAVSVDVCLYNVPGRTGVSLHPDTVARLAEIPNIAAIKEASGDMKVATEIRLRTDAIALYSGDDFTALPFVAQGGAGVISVVSNLVPDLMRELVDAADVGALEHARSVHLRLYPLIQALFVETNPIPVKSALAMAGFMLEEFRPPLHPLSPPHRATMLEILATFGLRGNRS